MEKVIKDLKNKPDKNYRIRFSCFCVAVLMLMSLFVLSGCKPCCPVIENFTLSPVGAHAGSVVNLSFDVCWYEDGERSDSKRCEADRELVQFRFLPSGTVLAPAPSISWTVTRGGGCDPVYCYRGAVSGVTLRPGDNRIEIRISADGDCPDSPETATISY